MEELEGLFTLPAAAARFEELRTRDALAGDGVAPLVREEALELLALGEVIARKAGYGRQLSVRSARAAGASWAEIGTALGTSRQAAWETHQRWIDGQAQRYGTVGEIGFDEDDVAAARMLAGDANN